MNLIIIACLFLAACGDGNRHHLQALMEDRQSGLLQEKRVGNAIVRLTYLPECWERMNKREEKADHSEMCFKINVLHSEKGKDAEKSASYGLDTVFQLVLNHDTLSPLLAQRIANGNLNGIEYLVIFERRPLAAVQQAVLIYKDWLFTSTRLVFPLQKNYLLKSDSLSCGL